MLIPIYPIMVDKVIIARVRVSNNQKRLNVPKQLETENWNDGDLIKLERAIIQ